MRIAIVSREVVPFFGAGIGTYAAAMARAWRGDGHEVHFLSEGHPGFVERGPAELNGAECHAVSLEGEGFYFARLARGVRRKLLELHARSPLEYVEFPDYFADGYFAIRGARLGNELKGAVLGIRLHTPTHECRVFNEEGEGGPEVTTLERCESAAIRGADVVISPSRSLLSMVESRVTFSAPAFVVPYPFEVDRMTSFHTAPAAAGGPTVLYFGRLERRKGVEDLVEAGMRLLQHGADVTFRFMGGDTQTGPGGTSMLEHLRSRIPASWKDRFVFESRRPRAEVFATVRAVAASGGVCCFPSRWENFPNVCLEAMALGAPVVGSDAGGMSEIIEDGASGVLFTSGDVASLEAALSRVLGDEMLRNRLGAEGPRRIASLCNPAAVVTQTVDAIEATRHSPGFGRAESFDEVQFPRRTMKGRIKSLASRWLG